MDRSQAFIDDFIFSMQEGLPGDEAHVKMLPTGRKLLNHEEKRILNYRPSAVAVVCYPDDGEIHSILTQRQDYPGKHGGQLSFPGGKFDPEDLDLENTARRECFEEIGIPMKCGITLGKLSEVYIPVSEFVVTPYVIFHEAKPFTRRNEIEVAEIIDFPLNQLLNEDSYRILDIYSSEGMKYKNTPHFCLSEKMVWGATALILSEFREILKRFY